jgi:hypothetical protein
MLDAGHLPLVVVFLVSVVILLPSSPRTPPLRAPPLRALPVSVPRSSLPPPAPPPPLEVLPEIQTTRNTWSLFRSR